MIQLKGAIRQKCVNMKEKKTKYMKNPLRVKNKKEYPRKRRKKY